MNFGKFDIVLIFSMSLAIVLMSFTFPALGMTDESDEVNESDIPEFNITSDRWDIAGDFPERSRTNTPTTGTLIYQQNRTDGGFENSAWMYGDRSDGWRLSLVNNGSSADTVMRAKMTYWFGGGPEIRYYDPDPGELNDTHDFEPIEITNSQRGNWSIEMTVVGYENNDTADFLGTVDYRIFNQPEVSGTSWLSRLPVVGGIFSVAEQLPGVLMWLASIVWWFVATTVEISLAVVTILLDVMIYTANILHWLLSTYSSIISAANSWAAVIVTMPLVLLFVEFAKIGMIGISLLPLT